MDMVRIAGALVTSTLVAIEEYRHRHGDDKPAKILLSGPAYAAMAYGTMHFMVEPGKERLFGIPVQCCATDGYHIQLAEPEIPLHDFIDRNPVVIFQPKKEEGNHGET